MSVRLQILFANCSCLTALVVEDGSYSYSSEFIITETADVMIAMVTQTMFSIIAVGDIVNPAAYEITAILQMDPEQIS